MNLIGRKAIFKGQKRIIVGQYFSEDERLTRLFFKGGNDWESIAPYGVIIERSWLARLLNMDSIVYNGEGERMAKKGTTVKVKRTIRKSK